MRYIWVGEFLLGALIAMPVTAQTDLATSDQTLAEGSSGTTGLQFSIVRTGDLGPRVNVGVTTRASGQEPASAPEDYVGLAGGTRLLLPAGQSITTVPISILGDTTPEADETFEFVLSRAYEVPVTPTFFAATDVSVNLPGQSGSSPAYDVAIADLDGDGLDDIASSKFFNYIAIRRNTSSAGALSFASVQTLVPFGNSPQCLIAADLNADGKLDLGTVAGQLSVWPNTSGVGSISFGGRQTFSVGDTPECLAAGDLDSDGKNDVVVTNLNSGNVTVLRNSSTGATITFSTQNVAAGPFPNGVAIADLDQDGKPDVVVSNRFDQKVTILKNAFSGGTLMFTTQELGTGLTPERIAIADIDGDGKPDLAVPNSSSSTLSIFRNTSTSGSISFEAPTTLAVTSGSPRDVDVRDIDGDGRLDLATANAGNNKVSIFISMSTPGALSFAPRTDLNTADGPSAVVVGDLDANGSPDLAASTEQAGTISILQAVTTVVPISVSIAVGTINDDDGGDGVPDSFSFLDQTNTDLNATVESNAVSVGGFNYPVLISVQDGEYRVDGNAYTTIPERIGPGTVVQVRHASANSDLTSTSTILTVGGVSDAFVSTTGDATPNAFMFADQSGVALSAPIASAAVTVSGITVPTSVAVTGGSYSVGCTGSFTSTTGSISNGQTICVRHTSAFTYSTSTSSTLTVGGVSDTFTSITSSPPPPASGGGGSISGFLLLAMQLAAALREVIRRISAARCPC